MTDHARLMPSAAAQTLQCHASVQLQEQYGLPEDQTSAEEGVAAHWVMAEMLEGVIVEPGSRAPNGVDVTEEMVDGAELLRDDVIEKLGPDWRSMIVVEQPLPPSVFGPDVWGTPDVRTANGVTPRRVWDYKFGHGLHEVYRHAQLLVYGALMDPTLSEDFEFTIVQPRAYHRDGPVRSWRTSLTEHFEMWDALRDAFDEALSPDPKYRTGPECRYCSARHACPELARQSSVDREWSRYNLVIDPGVDMPPGAISYELSEIDEALEILKARRTGLEEQAKHLIRIGLSVPSWEIGRGRGSTIWIQPVSHVLNMGAMYGKDLAKPPRAITPKQAIAAGMDPDLVRFASKHVSGEERLQRNNGERARRAFGGE